MKLLLVFLFVLISASAFAERVPLIVKDSGTGFVMPEWERTEKCEVFKDSIQLTKSYGMTVVTFQIPFSSDASLIELIEKASLEPMTEKYNGICDGPATLVRAGDVIFYSTGGCGSSTKRREGPYSFALMDIVGTFCQETY